MKNEIVKATLLLTIGGFVCKFLGALYRIPLSNILGAEGMGIYQLMFPLYSFALVFVTGGIPFAVSKHVSESLAKKENDKIPVFFAYAFVFSLIVSLFFSLVFFAFAKQISTFQGVPGAYFNYYIISIAIFFGCLLSVFRGVFQGYSNMFPTFMSQLIEQILKLSIGLLLSYLLLPYGVLWAVFGAICGLAISELLAFAYIVTHAFILSKKQKLHLKLKKSDFKKYKNQSRNMIKFSIGITVSNLIIPLTFAFQSLLAVKLLTTGNNTASFATSLFGIQSGMVNSIINFPTIISVSLAITLIPTLSFYLSKKDMLNVSKIIKNFYKTIWILTLPCIVGIFVLAKGIMPVLFVGAIGENLIDISVQLMMISAFSILFISITQITTVLLQTTSQTWKAFVSLVVFMVVNIVLVVWLTSAYSIFGFAVSNLISYALTSILNMFFLQKKYAPQLGLLDIFIPLIFSIFMGFLIYFLNLYLPINYEIIKLFICVIISIIFYFSFLILFKVIAIKHIFSKK